MHNTIVNLNNIKAEIQSKYSDSPEEIIAVSKTFSSDKILPLIEYGHNHFGENKVQEAVEKWIEIKKNFSNIKLHMIGKLQTNKVKYAIPLFDYIHSLDNIKLAEKIALEQTKINKNLKIFIQVNIGNEQQKNGINLNELDNFYKICVMLDNNAHCDKFSNNKHTYIDDVPQYRQEGRNNRAILMHDNLILCLGDQTTDWLLIDANNITLNS